MAIDNKDLRRGPPIEQPPISVQETVSPQENVEKTSQERVKETSVEEKTAVSPVLTPPQITSTTTVSGEKSEQLKRIESVMEEDVGDLYAKMDEAHKKLFKIEGEITAKMIEVLISGAKAGAQKILYLIRRWLMLIPGINKFFLEQEAKIKTDKVMAIIEEKSDTHS